MSKVFDDITGGQIDNGITEVSQLAPIPRAQAKRMGLPVDQKPHDHTGDAASTASNSATQGPVLTQLEKEQQEYVDNGGVMPINGITPSKPAGDDNGNADNKDDKGNGITSQTTTNNFLGSPSKPPRGEGFYDWWADRMRKEYEEDDKYREEQEKKLERQKLFAKIGTGFSAFSDAYNNSRYGTEYSDPSKSMANKWRSRYDKLRDDRHKRNLDYLNGMSKIEEMRGRSDYRQNELDYKNDALELRKKEEERRVAVAKANIEYTMSRTDAIISKEDVDYRIAEAKIALMNAGVKEKEASAEAKRIVSQSQAYRNYKQGNAAEIRAKNAGRGKISRSSSVKKANPMGSSNTGKKPNPMR